MIGYRTFKPKVNHTMIKNCLFVFVLFLLNIFIKNTCFAQDNQVLDYEPVSLSGPRLGVTVIGGEMADVLRDDYDAVPIVTQFGWQFEWRFFSEPGGMTGVVECVPLIGGLEQGLFLPSLSVPIGLRLQNGIEFGVGPNVSLSGFAVVLAAGITINAGVLNIPLNISLLPSNKGTRFSFLVGFNMARRR